MRILIPNYSEAEKGLDEHLVKLGHEVVSCLREGSPQRGETFPMPSRIELGMSVAEFNVYMFEYLCLMVQEYRIDLILPVSSVHPIMLPVSAVNEYLGLPGMTREQAALWLDKARYLDRLREHGFPHLATRYATLESDQDTIPTNVEFPCILKPALGSGGSGVFVAQNQGELEWFLGEGDKPRGKREFYQDRFQDGRYRTYMYVSGGGQYLVEEYVGGDLVSVAGVVQNGHVSLDMIYDIEVTDPPVQSEIGFHYPATRSHPRVQEIVSEALDILGLRDGPFMVDLIQREDRSYALIDFAPRMSSSAFMMSQFVNSPNMVSRAVASLNQVVPPDPAPIPETSIRVLQSPKGVVERIEFPEDAYETGVSILSRPWSGTQMFEARNDHQAHQRGVIAFSGKHARLVTKEFVERTTVVMR